MISRRGFLAATVAGSLAAAGMARAGAQPAAPAAVASLNAGRTPTQ